MPILDLIFLANKMLLYCKDVIGILRDLGLISSHEVERPLQKLLIAFLFLISQTFFFFRNESIIILETTGLNKEDIKK